MGLNKWKYILFESGANPYICKTDEEFKKLQDKYGPLLVLIREGFYKVCDKTRRKFMAKIVLCEDSPREKYQELFKCAEGTIFKVIDSDYETVMRRIEDYKPAEGDFETFPVTPGTPSYSLVGPSHVVITKNTLVTD